MPSRNRREALAAADDRESGVSGSVRSGAFSKALRRGGVERPAKDPRVDPRSAGDQARVEAYTRLHASERMLLAVDRFDSMVAEIRAYSGGSLIETDWPILRGTVLSAVQAIDRILGYKQPRR